MCGNYPRKHSPRHRSYQVPDLQHSGIDQQKGNHKSVDRWPIYSPSQKTAKSECTRAAMRLSKYQPTNGVLSRAARASLFFLKHVINQKAPRHPLTCGSNLQFARLVDQSDPILLLKKKKKKNLAETNEKKKKILLFSFLCLLFYLQSLKKNVGYTFFILFSWAEIEPNHWATELRSWAIEPWFDQAKPRSTSSQNPSHWAEIRAKPSWAKIFELFLCKQTQRFH